MLEAFKRIFKTGESVNSKRDVEKKLEIATCVILLEAAIADSKLSKEELQKIIDLLKTKFKMTDSSANELIEASKKERESSPGLWHFTNLINENLSLDEKYDLMEMIWNVIYSDGTLDDFEDYVAHKLLNLLHLDHSKFIEIKLKVKNASNIKSG